MRVRAQNKIYRSASYCPQHFLYFLPLPQGQGSFLPTLDSSRRTGCFLEGPSP